MVTCVKGLRYMLILIDNQSSFIKRFKRNFLSEQDFDYIIFDHNQPIILSVKSEVSGLILSGETPLPLAAADAISVFTAADANMYAVFNRFHT